MQTLAHLQPKNALRRSRELQRVGHVQDACDALKAAITTKKAGRLWSPEHEDMMIEFINLCVDLRDPRTAKDGLYNYRLLAQQQAPASLEKVITHLVDLSLRRAAEARARADVDLKQSSLVEDLDDAAQSPEALLMGAVTSEGTHERAEREILLPWVRHMWDTFRNVLENLRFAPKLEHLYHGMAIKAMAFCKAYNRVAEFRKLCKTLRDHLAAAKRNLETAVPPSVLSVETVERHLTTRFAQLEHCADMALWNEGYRTIEDISSAFIAGGGWVGVTPRVALPSLQESERCAAGLQPRGDPALVFLVPFSPPRSCAPSTPAHPPPHPHPRRHHPAVGRVHQGAAHRHLL